ncbi:MAG: hypothetical protein ACRD1X_21755, partial [Vicinamibacteria bacterium]
EQLTTEPISAEGLRETYSQSLQILIDDPFVRLIDVNSVDVTLEVQEEKVEEDSADPDAEDSSGPSGSSGRPGQTGQTGQYEQAGRASG